MSAPGSTNLTYLLDANVLISLAVRDHKFHNVAHTWFSRVAAIAVCPITEGALVRFLLREGESAAVAQAIITAIHDLSKCEFWGDDISYREVDLTGVFGHRQVTDSYLVSLAGTRRPSQVATFDQALAARHREACHLLSVD
ncbi:MAG: PIN domain-containing protein [Acidimicrobiia bacterium]